MSRGTVSGNGIVTDGLVLSLDAANVKSYVSGSTTWSDLTQNSNNTTLLNSPAFSFNNLGNIQFDGVDDYGTMNPSLIPSGNQITVGLWNYGLVAKESSVISCFSTSVLNSTRTVNIHLPWSDSVVYWDCGEGFDRVNTSVLNASQWQNSWHYWVFTKNVTTGIMRIYLDGNMNVEGSSKTTPIAKSNFSYLAMWPVPTNKYHQAYISNFQIYNRALSPTEVLQNYNATKTRFGL